MHQRTARNLDADVTTPVRERGSRERARKRPAHLSRIPEKPGPNVGLSLYSQRDALDLQRFVDGSPRVAALASMASTAQSPALLRMANGHAMSLPNPIANLPDTGGMELPRPFQQTMENLLGASLADVRVHVGALAPSVGASAFTRGSQIFLAPGRYRPDDAAGRRLLGHELAHVVQQRSGRVHNPFGSGVAMVHDTALEAEADLMGRRAETALPPGKGAHAAVVRSEFVSPSLVDLQTGSHAIQSRSATTGATAIQCADGPLASVSPNAPGGIMIYRDVPIARKFESASVTEFDVARDGNAAVTGGDTVNFVAPGISIRATVTVPENLGPAPWEIGYVQAIEDFHEFTRRYERGDVVSRLPRYPCNDSRTEGNIPWQQYGGMGYCKDVDGYDPGERFSLIMSDHPGFNHVPRNHPRLGALQGVAIHGSWCTWLIVRYNRSKEGVQCLKHCRWQTSLYVQWNAGSSTFDIDNARSQFRVISQGDGEGATSPAAALVGPTGLASVISTEQAR